MKPEDTSIGPRTRALEGPPRRPADAPRPQPARERSPTLVPPGTEIGQDEIMQLLIPGDMWNRMRDMAKEVGASGPIPLINIALERLRRALEAGGE